LRLQSAVWQWVRTAHAQQFDFPAAAVKDSAVLASAMTRLAAEVIAVYRENDRGVYPDNLFRLQFVAGRAAEAAATLDAWRAWFDDSYIDVPTSRAPE